MVELNFRMWLESLAPMRVGKSAKGDGYYWKVYQGRRRAGHIGGFETDGCFDCVNVRMEDGFQHSGLFQKFLQHVADQYPNGARSAKIQTSVAFQRAMRKMQTFSEDERYFRVGRSDGDADQPLDPTAGLGGVHAPEQPDQL